MKQKTFNRIVTIFDIVYIIIVMLIGYIIEKYISNLNTDLVLYTFIPISKSAIIKIASILSTILMYELIIVNLICAIQNRKNKRLLIWYTLPIIYIILGIIDKNVIVNGILMINPKDSIAKYMNYIMQGLLIIALIIDFAINIRKSKISTKKVLIYVAILLTCTAILWFNKSIGWILTLIMQLICSKNEKQEEKKLNNIFHMIIVCIFIITMLTSAILYLKVGVELKTVYKETENFIDKITKSLEEEKNEEENILLPVKRDGKEGYINQKGEEIVPCNYDIVSTTNINKYCAVAKKGNIYYIISPKGNILFQNPDIPAPWLKGKSVEEICGNDDEQIIEVGDVAVNNILDSYYNNSKDDEDFDFSNLLNNIYTDEDLDSIKSKECYGTNDNLIYDFSLKNGNLLRVQVPEYEEVYEGAYIAISNVSVMNGENMISEYKKILLPIKTEKEATIYTTKNGFVPYFDKDKKIAGLFDIKTFEKIFEVQGDYQILDKIDDYILVEDYSDIQNLKQCILNKSGEKLITGRAIYVLEDKSGFRIKNDNGQESYFDNNLKKLLTAKEIYVLEDKKGFIITKDNDKKSYLNNEFQEMIKDFEEISQVNSYNLNQEQEEIVNKLFICGEKTENGIRYSLYNKDGLKLTKEKYEMISYHGKYLASKEKEDEYEDKDNISQESDTDEFNRPFYGADILNGAYKYYYGLLEF